MKNNTAKKKNTFIIQGMAYALNSRADDCVDAGETAQWLYERKRNLRRGQSREAGDETEAALHNGDPAFRHCIDRENCGATFPDKDGKPDTEPKPPKQKASENYRCGVCGSGLVRRKGGKSDTYFWGCSAYPKCKQTYREKDNAPDFTK